MLIVFELQEQASAAKPLATLRQYLSRLLSTAEWLVKPVPTKNPHPHPLFVGASFSREALGNVAKVPVTANACSYEKHDGRGHHDDASPIGFSEQKAASVTRLLREVGGQPHDQKQ